MNETDGKYEIKKEMRQNNYAFLHGDQKSNI